MSQRTVDYTAKVLVRLTVKSFQQLHINLSKTAELLPNIFCSFLSPCLVFSKLWSKRLRRQLVIDFIYYIRS